MVKAKTILIIEDEAGLRTILAEHLTQLGYHVQTEGNGKTGLHTALTHHPDLIILDIMLPTMNGTQVLEELRRDDWGKQVKIMVLTNLSDPETTLKALTGGVREVIIKADWRLEDIVQAVGHQLEAFKSLPHETGSDGSHLI